MKKIGLVGGTGPESTLMYYKELNSRIDAATGGAEMPDIAIESVNFRKAWGMVSVGKNEDLSNYLSEKVTCLKKSGAEIISLTAGIEGVILGCTELPLLLNEGNCPVPCLDAVEIHLKKLIELAM